MAQKDATTQTNSTEPDFDAVIRRLREILEPLRQRVSVTKEGPDGVVMEIPGLEGQPWGYVAGIRRGKRYVSYYLMSLYASPDLTASMSPELRRGCRAVLLHHQGRRALFELARLTTAGFEPFVAMAAEVAKGRAPARSR
jgi:hypothetical protein